MKIMSLFTHLPVVPNLYAVVFPWHRKGEFVKNIHTALLYRRVYSDHSSKKKKN